MRLVEALELCARPLSETPKSANPAVSVSNLDIPRESEVTLQEFSMHLQPVLSRALKRSGGAQGDLTSPAMEERCR